MHILLADDEQFILDLMQMVLKSAGHTVRAVTDGGQALKAYETEKFDLVITDLSMPQLDGAALAKEIKARDAGQKVVLLSGYSDENAPPPGVDHVLSKPVKIDALTELVDRLTV
jgi:two-component system capsular synthesis sensor histidine kinase RcsC